MKVTFRKKLYSVTISSFYDVAALNSYDVLNIDIFCILQY